MSKKRALFVTQEMNPYTAISEISEIVRKLPQATQEKGMEIRVLMPKYGVINERRHRLHEVVRLSGMNIIVDDEDYPLIIKVASLPGARMQVYFLDNEEFFRRKFYFDGADEKPFEDNMDRMVFFCKGVMETVRKFGWPPDLIHCHGWLTSLIPLYLKTVYKDDPVFQSSKIVYSAYTNDYEKTFNERFLDIAAINKLEKSDLEAFGKGKKISLLAGGIAHADGVMAGSKNLSKTVSNLIEESGKPFLNFMELEELVPSCIEFYKNLMEEEEA